MQKLFSYFAPENTTSAQMVLLFLTGVFLTCLLVANLIGSLLIQFELPFSTPVGQVVLLTAGVIPFPITFLLTDLLNEFYGQKTARFVTLLGFVMSILVYVFLIIGEHLPVAEEITLFARGEYLHFSQLYTSMFVASLSAYLVGQLLDIQVFHHLRNITGYRLLWLRAQGSTVISQLFDSVIVTFIAFWGQLSAGTMWQLALTNYVWKFCIVVAITPLLYLGHGILKRLIQQPAE